MSARKIARFLPTLFLLFARTSASKGDNLEEFGQLIHERHLSVPSSGHGSNVTDSLRRKLLTSTLHFSAVQQKILPEYQAPHSNFGRIVDIDGDTVLIATQSNGVYVFTRNEPASHSSSWTQRAKLTSPDGSSSFGQISISGDTVAIQEFANYNGYNYDYHDNCYYHNGYNYNNYGYSSNQVLIFTRDSPGDLASAWSHKMNVTSPNCRTVCMYEYSCTSANGYPSCGCYNQNCTQTRVDCSQAQYENFGQHILLDGDSLFVATQNEVFVFARDTTGSLTSAWSNRSSVDLRRSGCDHYYGCSYGSYPVYGMATHEGTLAVLTNTEVSGNNYDYHYGGGGQVRIYARTTAGDLNSAWTLQWNMTSPEFERQYSSCASIDLEGDILVIGCPNFDASTGAAFVFERDEPGSDSSSWSDKARLTGDRDVQNSQFGQSVTCSGGVIVVGAPQDDEQGIDSGSLYTYAFDDMVQKWIMTAKLNAADARVQDNLGIAIASHDGRVIIAGAHNDDDNGPNSGSVYVFAKAPPPSPPPPSQSHVGVTYSMTGYSFNSFGDKERLQFRRAIASLLGRETDSVEIVSVTVAAESRRRRLAQNGEQTLEIAFIVHVLNEAIAKVIGNELDLFAVVDKAALINEFKHHGLESVGDIVLIKDSEYGSRLNPMLNTSSNPVLNTSSNPVVEEEEDGAGVHFDLLYLFTIVAVQLLL